MEVRKEDQRDPDEKVVEIEIERLRDFKNHPFKVQADSQMKGLQQLIKTIGRVKKQLNPKFKIEGILLTMADYRTKLCKGYFNDGVRYIFCIHQGIWFGNSDVSQSCGSQRGRKKYLFL